MYKINLYWLKTHSPRAGAACSVFAVILVSSRSQHFILCFCTLETADVESNQDLLSLPAWLGGGSIRSLNPSFSRGSLVISWLKTKNKTKTIIHVTFVDSLGNIFIGFLTGPFGTPGSLWTAVGTWSCHSCSLWDISWTFLWRLCTLLEKQKDKIRTCAFVWSSVTPSNKTVSSEPHNASA